MICPHSRSLFRPFNNAGDVFAREQEVILNDRLGKKLRIKSNEDDTIGDLKKLVAAQTGKEPSVRMEFWHA